MIDKKVLKGVIKFWLIGITIYFIILGVFYLIGKVI